jgi:hypothetical protein
VKNLFYALCLALAVFFLWGVVQLFELRFARGDVYPAYSTLRSDPLGAEAFYESLERLNGFEVLRNERSFRQLNAGRGTTLFLLGIPDLDAPEDVIASLEKFAERGGRLVVTFYPQATGTSLVPRKKDSSPSPSPSPSPSASPEDSLQAVKYLNTQEVAARWKFKLKTNPKLVNAVARPADGLPLEQKLSWHSALHFKDSDVIWKTVYAIDHTPILIERAMGQGSIVIASDSYFVSNEAMRRERLPVFLSWLVGPNHRVLFDETHFGFGENPGISALLRRFRLGGLLAGLVILAVLAVWKNGARLIPAAETMDAADEVIAGKDSFAGLVNLLRRNISPGDLSRACVDEWAKHQRHADEKISRARAIVSNGTKKTPVDLYSEISLTVNEKQWKPRT